MPPPDAQPATEAPPIRCLGLTKSFRDFWLRNRVLAVNDVDLDIRHGELFGLLGPNGSGKSTTIKMILGLLVPSAGQVAVFGRHPSDVAIKRRIGYLPEESYLYKFLTGRETLDYYARLFGLNRSQRGERIDTLLEMVGLQNAARRPVGEYSKGMQRKIGLAQALINDPDLLILDEPTSGMDPIATADTKRLLRRLRERGKTIVLCSHQLADVEDVCDRAAIMFGGRVRKLGRMDDLLTRDDQTTIHTDALDDAMIAEIEDTLARHGRHLERVERRRQRLEGLFLEIVEDAQREGLDTSGARGGGRIADFLGQGEADVPWAVAVEGGDAESRDEDAREMVAALVTPQMQAETTAAVEPPYEPESEPEDQTVSELIAAPPAAPPPPLPAPPTPAAPPREPRRPSPPPPTGAEDTNLLDSLIQRD